MPSVDETDAEVVVYWRPGCPFCTSLFRKLDELGVAHRRVDIWADPAAAAVVRSHARGNETVPTVVVGGVGLVNPSAASVLQLVGERRSAERPAPTDARPPAAASAGDA